MGDRQDTMTDFGKLLIRDRYQLAQGSQAPRPSSLKLLYQPQAVCVGCINSRSLCLRGLGQSGQM